MRCSGRREGNAPGELEVIEGDKRLPEKKKDEDRQRDEIMI